MDNVTTVKVEMMHKASYYNTYFDEELSSKVVQFPYKSDVSAFFILPDSEHETMRIMEKVLEENRVLRWQNSMRPR